MLHLYTPHHNAGAEMAAHALLRGLVDRGHRVDVILSRHHPEITGPYTVDGVHVHPRHNKGDPPRWLSDPATHPHVIITHLENTDRATILGALHRVPVVHLAHNTHPQTKWSMLRRPALVVANSAWMAEDLSYWWDLARPKRHMPPVIVIHPPIHAEDYRTKPGQHVTLINVTADKGADMFYALADRHPRTRFLGVEGAYGVQDRRQRPNVTWVDHVAGDRMRSAVYRRTRVLLMPSVYESYGRAAVEAACSGIPTIAAPTPGLREALGPAGVYADRDDVHAWSAHLGHLLTPDGWSAASQAALVLQG
jgi:glycosyltransferase involved in cell wall biosynthesis